MPDEVKFYVSAALKQQLRPNGGAGDGTDQLSLLEAEFKRVVSHLHLLLQHVVLRTYSTIFTVVNEDFFCIYAHTRSLHNTRA
jgi:hypothetical protein